MAFLALCLDKADGLPLRRAMRAVHLDYMIARRHLILFGGPLLDDDGGSALGSVIMLDLPDRDAVTAFLAEEPYSKAGLFEQVIIRRWRQMVPEPAPDTLARELARERAAGSLP